MKFWSVMRLSLHNLANNKLRTMLTVIVLFIMATVVMVLVCFGAGYFTSSTLSATNRINGSDNSVSIYEQFEYEYESGSYMSETSYLDTTVVEDVVSFYESDENFFHTIEFEESYSNVLYSNNEYNSYSFYPVPVYMGSNFLVGQDNYLIKGRMWDASDDGTDNIWLGDSFLGGYELGDEIKFEHRDETFTVCGFIENDNDYGSSQRVFIDYKKFDSEVLTKNPNDYTDPFYETDGQLSIRTVKLNMIHSDDILFGDATIAALQDFESKFQTGDANTEGVRVDSSLLADVSGYLLMRVVVVALLTFVAVLIVLLSIGSVSNTIKITVEQNRKFFGMMKAIGMQNKTVRRVVQWQAIFMVALGTLLATGVVIGLMYFLEPVLMMLLSIMFPAEFIVLSTSMPIFVPFAVFFALVGFVLLFTVKNLNKISKMDVIAVISEVD